MQPFTLATSLRLYGDVILKTKAQEILPDTDYPFKELVKDMIGIMCGFKGLGLAANQVGMLGRIIVIDLLGKPLVMLNPAIVEKSKKQRYAYEGCLSIPGAEIKVLRDRFVKTTYMDLDGKTQLLDLLSPQPRDEWSFELVSRVIQHEIDHLDGILILDREEK